MVASQNLSQGMAITLNKKNYRVESTVKVAAAKGTPFVKVKLLDLATGKTQEKNFKQDQNGLREQ